MLLPSSVGLPYYAVLDEAWMDTRPPTRSRTTGSVIDMLFYDTLSGHIDIVVAASCVFLNGPVSVARTFLAGIVNDANVGTMFAPQGGSQSVTAAYDLSWTINSASASIGTGGLAAFSTAIPEIPIYANEFFFMQAVTYSSANDFGLSAGAFTVLHIPTGESTTPDQVQTLQPSTALLA